MTNCFQLDRWFKANYDIPYLRIKYSFKFWGEMTINSKNDEKKEMYNEGCQSMYVIFAAVVASVGGVLFGYDIGITSGALLQLKEVFKLTAFEQEMVVSAVLIGAFFASFFGGNVVDIWGRKVGVGVSCLLFIAGALVLGFSLNFPMLIVGRVIVGVAISLSITSECTYISEISPPSRRGMMVSLNEVGITVGFLLAYLVNYLFITTHDGWRYMFGIAAILGLIQAFGVSAMPDSHHYLLIKGSIEKARNTLRSLRKTEDVEEEMEAILLSIKEQKNHNYFDLFNPMSNMRGRMFLGMMLVVLQQFSGNANVLYYAPTIFQHFGYTSDSIATLVTVGLGVVKVLSTIVTLLIVDRVGRRSLLLTGCLLMATSIMLLGIVGLKDSTYVDNKHTLNMQNLTVHVQPNTTVNEYSFRNDNISDELKLQMKNLFQQKNKTEDMLVGPENNATFIENFKSNLSNVMDSETTHESSTTTKILSVIALMIFVCAYGMSYGPVTWLILSEIFPGSLRGRAISVATCLNWGSNIIVSLTFLDVIKKFGIGTTFIMYGFISFVAAIFIFICVPETKGKTLEEINAMLGKRFIHKNIRMCSSKARYKEYPVKKDQPSVTSIELNDSF